MSTSLAEQATAPPIAGPLSGLLVDLGVEGPIRTELYGRERMEAHARALAACCLDATPKLAASPLLGRFAENVRSLAGAHARIAAGEGLVGERSIDAEWLADNYHIVEEVLREVRQDLPGGYDRELPKLVAPPIAGYPRIFALALALVAHTDSALDEARITRYVDVFQENARLTIGELWALPTMLRLVLIENLRRLADQMLWGWDERRKADAWALRILSGDLPVSPPSPHTADGPAVISTIPSLSDPFVVRALQRLRDQGPDAAAALDRLEEGLAANGAAPNEVLRREHARQAANQLSVGNCVISLRLLSAMDWNAFFERSSGVEAILRGDPSGAYPLQDFTTRDRYRRRVEELARRSAADEIHVAGRSIELAREGLERGEAEGHVGYYLIGRGLDRLRREVGSRPNPGKRLLEWVLDHPGLTYFGSIATLFAASLGLATALATGGTSPGLAIGILLLLVLALPVAEVAVGMVNHLLTLLLTPRVLPKLEFKDGIPVESTAMVVMPTMLLRPGSAATLLERLEIHYLANPDANLRFALLTDFADSPDEHRDEDDPWLRDALERVAALNHRHAAEGPPLFFLFHRRRLWNPTQGCWMGWERKRGKLSEFNRLLRGDRATSYSTLSSDLSQLPSIRYVITLDADTQLPRDSARRLVGTLAHPLNRPRFDPISGRVTAGHGVLQPRVSFHLSAALLSRFAAILASSGGIDPYSSAASDTYMDLFGVGSFTGKGIYDVDAFEAATGETFPENAILSHDLIEGNFARCGLLSDTELFDDFPARYHVYARREHRWIRGDWQLLPWLGPTIPTPHGRRPNPLPRLERWKLLDNLRRSLTPPALVVLVALGWTVLPGSPWLWSAIALAVPSLPILQVLVATAIGCLRNGSLAGLAGLRGSLPPTMAQAALSFVFLANQARLAVDAISRTLVRLAITRRHLLEWETAASTERRLGSGVANFAMNMWPAPALATALGLALTLVRPAALAASAPVLLAWFLSPLVAYLVSRPRRPAESPLSAAERRDLRRVARRTWSFFETFVGDEDHWLPPDNFQEEPRRIAHRTSPTNQGLLLLSTLAAHDLGYLGFRTLLNRLEKTFDTFDQMEKHWGHFYNWYDTTTLQPLPPAYISTVDSGNLLGALVALRQGLREIAEAPILGPSVSEGLLDAVGLARDGLAASAASVPAAASESVRKLARDLDELARRLESPPLDLPAWDDWLGGLDWAAAGLVGQLRTLNADHPGVLKDLPRLESLTRRIGAQVQDRRAELASVAPWLSVLREWELKSPSPATTERLGAGWKSVREELIAPASLAAIGRRADALRGELSNLAEAAPEASAMLKAVATAVGESAAAGFKTRLIALAERAEAIASAMQFRPLYKPERHLYAIGCNLAQGRLDGACYDLLASESCLTSFLTVARGEAPRRHWFQLGRPYIRAAGRIGLISWGGTMFEYLMPRLLLRSLPGTVVAEACRTAVARQVEYGRQMGVPWGISESAFASQYADGDYQYQSFGVPELGLKRGLDRDLVVAPYATALAAMIAPREAIANLRRLAAEGAEGEHGFYEAIDYTRDRLPKGKRSVVVRSYMAHHQGMSLVAIANAVLEEPMPRRFHADPMVRAVDLLLQEKVPRDVPLVHAGDAAAHPGDDSGPPTSTGEPLLSRRLTTAQTPAPRTHLISNLRYHVMLTNAGSGSSTCRGLDVTRWREDPTRDAHGQFLYVRDLTAGLVWSAGHQPIRRPCDLYEVTFAADKASFRRRDEAVETLLEVTVSLEQLAEVRRLTLTNHDTQSHEIELTTYTEVVLGTHGGDRAHPAFGKLFLETEWVAASGALLCRRRPREVGERPVWAVHVSAAEESSTAAIHHETDRSRFLGRGRDPGSPRALDPGQGLAGTTGPVLDPILSLRRRVRVAPGESVAIGFTTAVADSREEALVLADQYRDPVAVARAFELAWAHSQAEHQQRDWSANDAHLFQRLASHLLYGGAPMRASSAILTANRRGTAGLWKFGISGDLPILLVRVAEPAELALARQALNAHAFFRHKGLAADLVFLDDQATSYHEEVHQQLIDLVRASDSHDLADKPGGVFIRKAGPMSEEDKILLEAAARVVLVGNRGPLASQLERVERAPMLPPALAATRAPLVETEGEPTPPAGLLFPNDYGGFAADGSEYRILVRGQGRQDPRRNGKPPAPRPIEADLPPAPWINVVANDSFGFLVSEAGAGMTWAGNSQANRLTPWSNDPVADPPGEAVYLRDEETGAFWSPTPLPVPSSPAVVVRHGPGYTTFERTCQGIEQSLTLFVPVTDPVKILSLRVRNPGDRTRMLSATFYAEWILGTAREQTSGHVVTEVDTETGALLARNAFRTDFHARLAFADVAQRPRTLTGDRAEFLGRNGSAAAPAALLRSELSGRVGAALDPCAAIQSKFSLAPGEEKDLIFLLGEAGDIDEARDLVRRHGAEGRPAETLAAVRDHWGRILSTVQVQTPDPGMDLLLNRWLLYQVLSCRFRARSAFYQSGGAYGFRDQLQDSMAMVYALPGEARAHLLRAASRQFVEGDVQHWWHPPGGQGVRTRISDDYLWLPFVACHYLETTGDAGIMDESATYLEAPPLRPGQDEDYGQPAASAETGTLYHHCLRALERGREVGSHGLPLMGTGDWNDGMNRVGAGGRGESVWDAWFQIATLSRFATVAAARGDQDRAGWCLRQAEALRSAIEAGAWDGSWYRRAYFDDGTPLGTSAGEECRIDSIAQTWAVISGRADPERARRAMAAVDEHLVRRDDGLILLLSPPFDTGDLEPGYIKGYLPGIRENGGQYTHAATWVILANALLGRGERAWELFQLLNPIRHADAPDGLARYKVEPYVVAADVYGVPPHIGRGGWTWYTGSAAWLYRVALESILGFQLRGDRLTIAPCIPASWSHFNVEYRFRSGLYRISVENPAGVERGVASVTADGAPGENPLTLLDDGAEHQVVVVLGVNPTPDDSPQS